MKKNVLYAHLRVSNLLFRDSTLFGTPLMMNEGTPVLMVGTSLRIFPQKLLGCCVSQLLDVHSQLTSSGAARCSIAGLKMGLSTRTAQNILLL